MDKIMVPVDFSSASSWGFYYAYEMAKANDADIVVVHLYWPPYVESIYPEEMIDRIEKDKEDTVLGHLRAATCPPLKDGIDGKVKITYAIGPNSDYTIASIAKEQKPDLIVMGTHGADDATNKVWGSNTSKTIMDADYPVLVVPKGATYGGIKNIAYATDFDKEDNEWLAQLQLVALTMGANLHCVHVNKSGGHYHEKDDRAFRESFDENFESLSISFVTVSATTVEEGLEVFCRENEIDLLAMLSHEKTFWEKTFSSNSSMTESMIMRSKLPLLAFHNK